MIFKKFIEFFFSFDFFIQLVFTNDVMNFYNLGFNKL